MSIVVNRKNLGAFYWTVSGSNLVLPGVCSYSSKFFALDPGVINTLGGTKASVFTSSQLVTDFQFSTSSDVTVLAADYADTNWTSLGWTPSDDTTFFTEVSTFISNNLNDPAINPNGIDMVVVVTRGNIGGTDYSIPFFFFGNAGDASGFVSDANTSLLLHLDGNVTDSSSNSVSMTASGISYVAGKYGQAADVSAGFVSTTGSVLNVGTGNFTLECWLKATGIGAVGSSPFLTAGQYGVSQAWGFAALTNKALFFVIGQSGGYQSSANQFLTDGQWHHYVAQRSSGIFSFLVDGVVVSTTSSQSASIPFSSSIPLGIGKTVGYTVGDNFFINGVIDEVRISSVARY